MKTRIISIISLLLIGILLTGCATAPVSKQKGGYVWGEVPNAAGEIKGEKPSDLPASNGLIYGAEASAPDAAPPAGGEIMPGGVPSESEGGFDKNIQSGTLTGAELSDNEHYDEFLKESNENNWYDKLGGFSMNARERIVVRTLFKSHTALQKSVAVPHAAVKLYDANDKLLYSAVSNSNGVAYLFANAFEKGYVPSYVVCTNTLGEEIKSNLTEGQTELDAYFTLDTQNGLYKKLDLMFMIDTTGSMGDELEYLKVEIADIINSTKANVNMDVRTSVNFYRDSTDEYVVRYFPFESDASVVTEQIGKQSAAGGGDYEEAVHTALENAIYTHSWEKDSVKLLFLVLDAPPHAENDIYESIKSSTKMASEMGIRIIPIVSSGSNELVEYLTRTMATLTGGTYTFLTNDSGIGFDHADPTTDVDYEVEPLNAMIKRIILEYCTQDQVLIER